MVVRDVKEEEVVNRITKMAAKLHFSGDRSSILGMKVSAEVTNWGTWMTTKRPKLFQSGMISWERCEGFRLCMVLLEENHDMT